MPNIMDVAGAILQYLENFPGAADTSDGIAKWWVPAALDTDVETVNIALSYLLREGLVQQYKNTDKHVVYCLAAK